jgi:triacylglycerol lipase
MSPQTQLFTSGQFHGFVGYLEHITVVSFRGTQNVGNCLTDAETALVSRFPYMGRVHSGFAEAVDAVWPQIVRLLGQPSHRRPLWVTGHSLGGAMATLASARLAGVGYSVRAVYTYGSPRPGDQVFHRSYRLPNYRFVHDDDIVPHLPFRWCYKHVGELKLMDEQGNLIVDESAWHEKKQALSRHAKRVQRAHAAHADYHKLTDFDWLADHHLDGYLGALEKILARVPRRRRMDRPVLSLPEPAAAEASLIDSTQPRRSAA